MLKILKSLFQPSLQPELNFYWYGLQGLVLILPWNNVISAIASLVFIGLFVIQVYWRQKQWRSLDSFINRGWLGLAVWLLITTAIAFDPATAGTGLLNFLPFFLLFAIASYLIQTPQQLHRFAWLTVISSLPVSGLGILQAVINQPRWTLPRLFGSYEITLGLSPDSRVASLFGHFNEAAMYLLLVLPIAYYFVLRASDRSQKIWAAIALLTGFITLILLGSRNAWVLAAVGVISIAVYYHHWWLVGGISTSGILLSWAVWGKMFRLGGEWLRAFLPLGLVNRLSSAFDSSLTDYASTAYRLGAWQFATHLIQLRPIQGWGLRSFALIATVFRYDLHGLPHEHNFYLTLAVGGGLTALLGFVVLLLAIIWQSLKANIPSETKELIFLMVVAIALYYLSGCLDVVFYEPRVNILSWLILAAIYGVARRSSLTF